MRIPVGSYVVAVALLACAAPIQAQVSGTIAGHVTDASSGAPLASSDATFYNVVLHNSAGHLLRSTPTAADGSYALTGVSPGTYFLRTQNRGGHVDELHPNIVCSAADCDPVTGTPVTVAADATTVVDFALDRGGSISVNVTLPSPTGNLKVSIYNAAGALSLAAESFHHFSFPFVFSGLPAGSYFARVSNGGSSTVNPPQTYVEQVYGGVDCPTFPDGTLGCAITSGTPIPVTAQVVTSITMQPSAGGAIAGRVRRPDGSAINTATISIFLNVQRFRGVGVGSEYQVTGLPAGQYQVLAEGENRVAQWYKDVCNGCTERRTPVTVVSGATTSEIDFVLPAAGSISGTVTWSTGLPFSVYGPTVSAYNPSGELVASTGFFTPQPADGATLAYTIPGLAPGTYYVRTETIAGTAFPATNNPSGGWLIDQIYGLGPCIAADCDVRRGTPVTVSGTADTTGINFDLKRGAAITGTVPAFPSAPDAVVEIFDSRGVTLPNRTFISGAGRDRFIAAGLVPGVYYLRLARHPGGFYQGGAYYAETLYNGQLCADCPATSGTPIVVAEGATVSGIDFTAAAGRSVRGTIRDAGTSAPLSTIAVDLYNAAGRLIASDETSAIGTFRLDALAPGTYYARTRNTRGYADQAYKDVPCSGCAPATGSPIVVTAEAGVDGVDFSLARGTSVSGSVTGEGAGQLGDVPVSLFDSAGALVARQSTNYLGRFEALLSPGTYYAHTGAVPGFRQILYRDLACPSGTCTPSTGTPIIVAAAPVANVDFSLPACGASSIAPLRLATAASGRAYRQTLTVTGGSGSTFSIASGTLPAGLALDPTTGVISGTPSTAGSYTFTVSASDASGCVGIRTYTLDVPFCTFSNPPSPLIAPAAGAGHLFVQGCHAVFTVSTDVPWISAYRTTFSRFTPFGTFEVVSVAVTIAPNASPESRRGHISIGPRVVEVIQAGTAVSPPFGVLETPADGALVTGSIAVSGWALDDLAVDRVAIYRDPVAGEGPSLIYLGDATFVEGARPDVEAAYPTLPGNTRAGWATCS